MSYPNFHLAAEPVRRDRLIRLPEVLRLAGLRKSTIYSMMSRGEFPRGISLTTRCVAWSEAAVLAWVQQRISAAGVNPSE